MNELKGWYTYTPHGRGIDFAGNGQAILFGRDHQKRQCWFVLVRESESRWAAFRQDDELTPVGSMVIEGEGDSITVTDHIDPVALGDSGFSPLPPPLFSGVLSKIL